MFRKRRAFPRICFFVLLIFWFLIPLLWACMFRGDVIVHIGVHLAGEEALMAVEQLCTFLVKYHFTQPTSIHFITKFWMGGAHVDLHIFIICASETAVVALQA